MSDEDDKGEVDPGGQETPSHMQISEEDQREGIARLFREFVAYSDNNWEGIIDGQIAIEALHGDVYATKLMARWVRNCLLADLEMSPAIKHWLGHAMTRVMHDQKAACALSNSTGRKGAPSKATFTMAIAMAVQNKLLTPGGPSSVEEAWEMVAEEQHLSASRVKSSWIKWKPKLDQSWRAGRFCGKSLLDDIQEQLKENRKAKSDRKRRTN